MDTSVVELPYGSHRHNTRKLEPEWVDTSIQGSLSWLKSTSVANISRDNINIQKHFEQIKTPSLLHQQLAEISIQNRY